MTGELLSDDAYLRQLNRKHQMPSPGSIHELNKLEFGQLMRYFRIKRLSMREAEFGSHIGHSKGIVNPYEVGRYAVPESVFNSFLDILRTRAIPPLTAEEEAILKQRWLTQRS